MNIGDVFYIIYDNKIRAVAIVKIDTVESPKQGWEYPKVFDRLGRCILNDTKTCQTKKEIKIFGIVEGYQNLKEIYGNNQYIDAWGKGCKLFESRKAAADSLLNGR